jgi:cellulose synthase/poly-beta-1,6-N-acetylglucosamine synthase-like glycosyltransferase
MLMALIDYVPRVFFNLKKATVSQTGFTRIPRYLIMPTVYGDISYLQNISFLKKYANKVVICTSKYESPEFYHALRKVCRRYGFRYICADLPFAKGKPNKNAYTIYRGAFHNFSRLGVRKDTPCLLIDADTYSTSNVNNLIRTFIAENVDIASLRCEVSKPKTVIEHLQAFEYRMAMDNRRMDPWLTSGACNVAKAGVFQKVFNQHSNFFAGGDIEIGKLARVMGYRVKHIEFTFFTTAPNTFRDWFNQRIIWFSGGVRHHVTNIASYGWHHFFMLVYNSLIIYLLLPLRWLELINFPWTLLLLIALSWIYMGIIVFRRQWKPVYLLLPFYSFVQSMVILPIAYVRYAKLAWRQRSFGFLHYEMSQVKYSTLTFYRALNISSAIIILYAALIFTVARWEYWMQHGAILRSIFR